MVLERKKLREDEKWAWACMMLSRGPMQTTFLRSTLGFLLLPLLLGACALPGQRATTGECPEGEICSDLAPDGVYFLGAPFSDDIGEGGLSPTAVGGTQTVTALSGLDTTSPPFAESFDAVTADPEIAKVGLVTPPSLVLHGVSEGNTLLRLLEPGTEKLLDRIQIHILPATRLTIYPRELAYLIDGQSPWALLAGSTPEIVIRLQDSEGFRVVDESLSVEPSGDVVMQTAWDLVEVSVPNSGELSFQGMATGLPFLVKASIVTSVDAIKPSPSLGNLTEPESVPLGGEGFYCFYAESGGTAVAGASWTFTSSAGVEVSPQDTERWASCVGIKGLVEGPATLDVEASGFKTSFQLEVKKSTAKSARLVTLPLEAKPGERAGGL